MRATILKKKYPKVWEDIYYAMAETLKNVMSQSDVALFTECYPNSRIEIISNNAAFLGCYELYKRERNLVSIIKT